MKNKYTYTLTGIKHITPGEKTNANYKRAQILTLLNPNKRE
jgi:hypothetical protein